MKYNELVKRTYNNKLNDSNTQIYMPQNKKSFKKALFEQISNCLKANIPIEITEDEYVELLYLFSEKEMSGFLNEIIKQSPKKLDLVKISMLIEKNAI